MDLRFDFPNAGFRFGSPSEIITARTLAEVLPALQRVQVASKRGAYAAGFVAYEAASAFDSSLVTRNGGPLPLVWFGIFPAPAKRAAGDGVALAGEVPPIGWKPSVTPESYRKGFALIHKAISRGETYQLNYTFRLRAAYESDPRSLYAQLRLAQGSRYCAYMDIGRYSIVSASPELFFHWNGEVIETSPMKGTAARGRWAEEDAVQAKWLSTSEKNRAENLMIVDLLRNDLGKVARAASVEVPTLFAVERFPTLFQMTSTVRASPAPGLTLDGLFAALFPSGSVTGAPKASTMRYIATLEDSPRGIYCGAIGLVLPGGEAIFNVAIRTALVDKADGTIEYGTGGGITWDSEAGDEYEEARAKARIVTDGFPRFSLFETLRLEDGTYSLLDRHLSRIVSSATYFDFPLDPGDLGAAVGGFAVSNPLGVFRVKLVVSADGSIGIEGSPLAALQTAEAFVGLASAPVSRRNRLLFHKTTCRVAYDAERAARPNLFDVLLMNEEGELTEFTIGNLVVELDGKLYTPPIDCGLLAGTLRAELLANGILEERVLRPPDLADAKRIWLINSLRGWTPVRFAG